MIFLRVVVVALTVLVSATWATPRTVTLSVPGMTCAACPITIKAALNKVPGVTRVDMIYEVLDALVIFDDAKTNADALVKATTAAGYPSTVKLPRKNRRDAR